MIKELSNLSSLINFYQGKLEEHSDTRAVLEQMDIGPTLLAQFRLGYSDGTLKGVLSDAQRAVFQKLGILSQEKKEVLQDKLVIPLENTQGVIESFCGISLDEGQKEVFTKTEGVFFNIDALSTYRDEIILTNSLYDTLILFSLGFLNIVPVIDPKNLILELVEQRIKTIILGFENEQLVHQIQEAGIPVKIVVPDNQSWHEYKAQGGTKRKLKSLIAKTALLEGIKNEEGEILCARKDGVSYHIEIGQLEYIVTGVKELFVSSLKVNVMVKQGEVFDRDNVDLFSSKSRQAFASLVSPAVGVSQGRIEKDLLTILNYLEEERDSTLNGKQKGPSKLTSEEIALGMELLTSPDLFDRIVEDMEMLGYVGEAINKKLMYLAASSRKLPDPISVMVLSESASGKSHLIDTVKKLMPPEDVVSLTSLSDQSPIYLPEDGLLHKFLVLGEAVHGDKIEYLLREMISSHELSRLVTVNDSSSGEMVSKIIRKKVIVSLAMSGTNFEMNQENASRSFVINTDESEDQTRKIHEQQREKYSFAEYKRREDLVPRILKVHHSAQRLLEARMIINPFARFLDFPSKLMRSRRDHARFIDAIACVCFLRQFQKEVKTYEGKSYIECDLKDYEIAYELIMGVLPATVTTFPKSAKELYEVIRTYVADIARRDRVNALDVTFTQRDLREHTSLTQMFIKKNMKTLVEYEYLVTEGTTVRGKRNHYRLFSDKPVHHFDTAMIPHPASIKEQLD